MSSLWHRLVPFRPVRIYRSTDIPTVKATILEDVQDCPSLQIPDILGGRVSFSSPGLETEVAGGDLPLSSIVEEWPLISSATLDTLPEADKLVITSRVHLVNHIIDGDVVGEETGVYKLLEQAQVTLDDLFVSLPVLTEAMLPPGFLKYIDLTLIKVSSNLHRPIQTPEKVVGMNYAYRYWRVETLDNKPRQRPGSRKPQIRPIHKGKIGLERPEFTRIKPSFWDLIFVLLQPPLTFTDSDHFLLPHDLYAYQVKGVQFLIDNRHALLADDMGTGKTVMTLVALKILMQQQKVRSALILCPPSVLHEWQKHLDEWTPELVTCFVRGSKQVREMEWEAPAHVYVTAFGTLRNDIRSGRLSLDGQKLFDVVVVDEAHHIKNPDTAQSRAIRKLSPKYRWALTGTPVQNRLDDLIALFEFIYPDLLTPFDSEDRVREKVKPYFLRRRKQEVIKDLPPKIRQDLWLEMEDAQQEAYRRIEHDVIREINDLGDQVTKQHIFAKIQKLKQICNFAPGQTNSPKIVELLEQVEEIAGSGNKVIVFSQYDAEGVAKIELALKKYGTAKIIGGQSDSIRRAEIDRFKSDERVPVLIASLRSGGEGLNLTEASYVIHFDHWWNPAVMWQAEDRVHRRGQVNSVNIYSYWILDTIDERIHNILERKGLLFKNVVDSLAETEIEDWFTKEDLLEILGVKWTKPTRPKVEWGKWLSMGLDEIRASLFEIKPTEFEELVQELMHYLGYPNVKVTRRSGDGGIDVLSSRNTGDGVERIAAQCKRYRGTVGVRVAREFLGAIKDNPSIVKGYLITTGEFTTECINFCVRNGIEMISGMRVAEYIKKFALHSSGSSD